MFKTSNKIDGNIERRRGRPYFYASRSAYPARQGGSYRTLEVGVPCLTFGASLRKR
jgi:hypothetical protein